MRKKECIAMLLAGGQGSRLLQLTQNYAKPAVSFGGRYRIIDFALSNCANSGISTVGVLTQYKPYMLHHYIGTGSAWNLNERGSGVSILPPYYTEERGYWYEGTADAIFRNLEYLEVNDPEYVLILSGDHLYRMDYNKMLKEHKEKNADLTIAVMPVEWSEASRFGILSNNEEGRVTKFAEKPARPESNLASMGIYIFKTEVLKSALEEDSRHKESDHDFGKNVIPMLLEQGKRLYTHEFNGFWRDVGTISSYYETSMCLLGDNPDFKLKDKEFPILSGGAPYPPHLIGKDAEISDSLVENGCVVKGKVTHSILSTACKIGKGAVVEDSILLPGVEVGDGAVVRRSIIGEGSTVKEGAIVQPSEEKPEDIWVVGNNCTCPEEGE